jgi:hypothetical protein
MNISQEPIMKIASRRIEQMDKDEHWDHIVNLFADLASIGSARAP